MECRFNFRAEEVKSIVLGVSEVGCVMLDFTAMPPGAIRDI